VGSQNLGSPIIIGLSGFNTPYVLQGAFLTGWLAIAADAWFAYISSSMSLKLKIAAGTES
jgi:osmoprotectant transport system permease protein